MDQIDQAHESRVDVGATPQGPAGTQTLTPLDGRWHAPQVPSQLNVRHHERSAFHAAGLWADVTQKSTKRGRWECRKCHLGL